jgi:hypothetical protein
MLPGIKKIKNCNKIKLMMAGIFIIRDVHFSAVYFLVAITPTTLPRLLKVKRYYIPLQKINLQQKTIHQKTSTNFAYRRLAY